MDTNMKKKQNQVPIIICTVTNDLTYDQRMIRICTSLSKAGYEVHLVGRTKTDSKPLTTMPFQQKRLACWFQKGKLFYIEYQIRLFFYLCFKRFDVLCAIDLDSILPVYYVSRMKRKKCVYDAHEYYTESPEIVHRPRIKKIWEAVARHTIPNIKHAYTVCESIAGLLEQRYGTPFETIRNVPFRKTKIEPILKENKASKKHILLYQGMLNEGRGLEQMIAAMPHLEEAVLWLVGEGDVSQQLRQLVKDKQLEHRVKFWGYQRPKDLKHITAQATIGLNLLENKGLSYYYSLANKAFDYIQAEIPSINMNFPEYQRINQSHEVFVLLENLETAHIVQQIQELLNDTSFYKKLVKNCKTAKEIYIWEKEEQKLLDFYKKIT